MGHGARTAARRVTLGAAATVLVASAALAVPAGATVDGPAFSWGSDATGELGYAVGGTGTDAPGLVTLAPGVGAVQISAAAGFTLAVGSDGNVYAWGANGDGQLGDGTFTASTTPQVVALAPSVTAVDVSAGATHSLAVGSDGNVYAWGSDLHGALGDGATAGDVAAPEMVTLAPGVTASSVAAGDGYSLAAGSDGNLYAWGFGGDGELGDGSTVDQPTPVAVPLGGGVQAVAVAAGPTHAMAIGSNGWVYVWGAGTDGVLGDGSLADQPVPEPVTLPPEVSATAIAAGATDSLVVASDGNLYAWGSESDGQLGDGVNATTTVDTPEAVTLPVPALSVAAGTQHTVALGADGQVYAWGGRASGAVGDGSTSGIQSVPEATGLDASAVAAGPSDSFAIGPVAPTGEAISVSRPSGVWGNAVEKVSGSGWTAGGDAAVTLYECAGSTFGSDCSASLGSAAVGQVRGGRWGTFSADIEVPAGTIDGAGDTCGLSTSPPCDVVAVGANGDSAATGLAFATPTFGAMRTTGVLGNYADRLQATRLPAGDPVQVLECDGDVVPGVNTASDCDAATEVGGTVGSNGTVAWSGPLTLRVGQDFTDGAGGNCAPGGTCELVLLDPDNPALTLIAPVTFATPTASVSSSVLPGHTVSVSVHGFPVGETVQAVECDPMLPSGSVATNCDAATAITGTVGASGTVSGWSPARITVLTGATTPAYADGSSPPSVCTALGNSQPCYVAVRVPANPAVTLVSPLSVP